MSLIAVEEALARLLAGAAPIADEELVPLRAAHGRVLAREITALRTQPDFDASAMDGYAVRAADFSEPGAGELTLIGESAAGSAFGGVVGLRQAVRIFTGAPMPQGADAVLIQENAERLGPDRVRALRPVDLGRHVRRRGNDFSEGATLLAKGQRLTAGAVALAASGGHPELPLLRRPLVAILATGDELVLPGEPLGPSQIVASNGFGVAAIVETAGGTVLDLGIAPDNADELGARLDQALNAGADIFVAIGGASVGDHDLVGRVFADRGVEMDFQKVAMRPGKPIMAGRLGAVRLIGLPGNPASSLVSATIFLRPLVRRLAGREDGTTLQQGVLEADVAKNDERAEFMRATLKPSADGPPLVSPLPRQDSSLLSIHAAADALLYRPIRAAAAHAGETCLFLPLD